MDGERYIIDTINAAHLIGNPLDSPAGREVHVYLPPCYHKSPGKRYPVIYLLHGYAGNARNLTIVPNQRQKISWLPPEILDEADWSRICDYAKLDELIDKGKIAPFILIQTDGSLHIHDKDGTWDIYTGETRTKGSFYVNSRFTGDYENLIVEDLVNYIDTNYQTVTDPRHRALMGASMGGYGTLRIILLHPGRFSAAAALSPANVTTDMLDWKLVIPMQERLLGQTEAERGGQQLFDDILDTQDIIFSKDHPLMPTVVRDSTGRSISWDEAASYAWKQNDINTLAEEHAANIMDVALLMNCEKDDEFGLTGAAMRMHATFDRLDISHEYEIYDEPLSKGFSPHIFGIAYQLIPSITWLLGKIA